MFDKLSRLSIKVTDFCNLNCIYCHQLSDDKANSRRFCLYDELESFLLKCPLDDTVQVMIGGGEISLAMESFHKAYKMLTRVSKKKEVRFRPCIVTNGSNFKEIAIAIKKKIIAPEDIVFSWDGIYSYSKTRQGKNNMYNDAHFNNVIKWIGANNYGSKISIAYAITPYNVNDIYNSLKFMLANKVNNFSFYYVHEADYSNEAFKKAFKHQLELIAELFKSSYKTNKKFIYYNWQNMYSKFLEDNDFISSISCKKLGRGLHVDIDGSLYGCVYFGDHNAFQLGHLLDGGLYESEIKAFTNEFLNTVPSCNYKECNHKHCFECPGSNYIHNGGMNNKTQNLCELLEIERNVFNSVINKDFNINKFEEKRDWLIVDPGYYQHIEKKKQSKFALPCANSYDHYKQSQCDKSDNLWRVKNWLHEKKSSIQNT